MVGTEAEHHLYVPWYKFSELLAEGSRNPQVFGARYRRKAVCTGAVSLQAPITPPFRTFSLRFKTRSRKKDLNRCQLKQ